MRKLLDWFKWEFGREIEETPVIRLITIERFVKAAVLIVGALALLVLGNKANLHQIARHLQDELNLTPGQTWWRQAYEKLVVRFGSLSHGKQDAIAAGALLYGALEAFEGVGLLLRRRWAEYLVLIATAAFLPLEIDELVRRATVFKAGALLVNIAIIAYLIWRKRLFLERPGHEAADATEPVPGDLVG